jgi:hypothetical protein
LDGQYIVNVKDNKVFDVEHGKDVEGYNVHMWNRHKGLNQKWKIVYADTVTEQTKGLNKDFGFFVNKPFYIRSRLPSGRMANCQNGVVYQNRWKSGNTAMQWYFDPVTKTIKNQKYKNYSLEILYNQFKGG